MGMIIVAVLAICFVCSTKATRAAGREAVRRYEIPAAMIVAALWAAVIFLPRD